MVILMTKNITTIILSAGKGTRMKSQLPKVLHPLAGLALVRHGINTAHDIGSKQIIGVVANNPQIVACFENYAIQEPQLGTAHATSLGWQKARQDSSDIVLILYADTPLISQNTLQKLCAYIENGADCAVLGFLPENPAQLGRLIVADNRLQAIVEAKDASAEQLQINLCNSGVMAVKSQVLSKILPLITNDNQAGEYYLTDLIKHAVQLGHECGYVIGENEELQGVNSQEELAICEKYWQNRQRRALMQAGVRMIDPDSVFLSHDTKIAPDCVIEPCVHFGVGVEIAEFCQIRAFSYLESCKIGANCVIGPYARIRPHSEIASGAHIGNFVEIKNSQIHTGAKINHLSYIGDAQIGQKTNIGAGTITCNYDGKLKHKTIIGENVFIGSNSALVAPITINDNAVIGAGSVIVKPVPARALGVGRARQVNIENYSKPKDK